MHFTKQQSSFNIRTNKKAVTEITSFVFLTFIVVVISMSAYFILQNVLNDNLATFDRNNAEIFLKKFDQKSKEVMSFDNTSGVIEFSFTKGNLEFQDNQLIYQSLVKYDDSNTTCFNGICYFAINGYERFYYNLSSSYVFENNLSLVPGNYILMLTNIKNGKKINVKIR